MSSVETGGWGNGLISIGEDGIMLWFVTLMGEACVMAGCGDSVVGGSGSSCFESFWRW